ncbi:hypothetical protein ASE00_12875 [Sphingomonas sp. Root710]|uniref:alpha/beta hydrolase family protein n=1 Tax=Sphingomonas sp. Root710 TaxID=1736594 RepID=UPI000701D2E0|nr:prolyl oligopeptidase family serine peptidase [Sphingomonas sp. Root710]KRB82890.1 hypothetical protein ASE00_12875 [Sphingomonas sp. Root710]
MLTLAKTLVRVWLLLYAGLAPAKPFSVDAMLRNQSYGHVWVDPDESWAVVERRARYDSASDYGLGSFTTRQLSKLWRIDLVRGAAATPLFDQRTDTGYWAEGFSPSGRYLAVMALRDRRLRLGLFDMRSGSLRWLAGTPDMPFAQPGPLWLSDDRLIRVQLSSPQLPRLLDGTSGAADRVAAGWQRQAGGHESSLSWLSSTHATAGDSRREVRLQDLTSGSDRLLWRGELSDVALSADRRFIAIVSLTGLRRPRGDEPLGLDFQSRGRTLTIIEVASGRSWHPCLACDFAPNLLRWSPTGAALLVFARGHSDSGWQTGRLLRLEPAARRIVRCSPPGLDAVTGAGDAGSGLVVAASWAGRMPLLFARRGSARADWYALEPGSPRPLTTMMRSPPSALVSSTAGGIALLGDGAYWRIGLDGAVRARTAGIVSAGSTTLDPYHFGGRGMFNMPPFTPQPLIRRLSEGVATLHGRAREALLDLPPGRQLLAWAPRSRRAVLLIRHEAGDAELALLAAGQVPRVVDRINMHLAGLDRARAVALAATAPDGSAMTHWLLLPAQPASTPPPLVVVPYPGSVFGRDHAPSPGADRIFAETNGLLLAAHGYAVLYPSLPLAADNHEPAAAIAAGVDRAVDAAIASGRIDPQRIALWGHSYGGYAALVVAASSRRYRAIVASAAPSNLLALHGTLVPRTDSDSAAHYLAMPGATEGGQFRMGAPPWAAPERYLRNSPALAADKIETPLLLVQGDLDFIPLAQSEALFTALYRRDRPVELLRYRGENHMLASPANIREMLGHVLAWLDERLGR